MERKFVPLSVLGVATAVITAVSPAYGEPYVNPGIIERPESVPDPDPGRVDYLELSPDLSSEEPTELPLQIPSTGDPDACKQRPGLIECQP